MVDGLLSFIDKRMRGALDLGLVLLLEPPSERYTRYISDHVAGPIRAAAVVLRLAVAQSVSEPPLTPFQVITAETELFVTTLEELAGFSVIPEERLRSIVEQLGKSCRRLRASLVDLAERLGFEPTLSSDATPEREGFYDDILDRLYADLLAERGDR